MFILFGLGKARIVEVPPGHLGLQMTSWNVHCHCHRIMSVWNASLLGETIQSKHRMAGPAFTLITSNGCVSIITSTPI